MIYVVLVLLARISGLIKKHPDLTSSVRYYLYSFEGTLTDKHWDEIGKKERRNVNHRSANKALHRTAITLRSIAAGEL